ncbi:MAG: hypothetical protein LBC85_06520 [Fibromonadaceae bacterium]|jgi:hypothetical protein|nr:hypothetical protein [Fibromonadaceae bacterium]
MQLKDSATVAYSAEPEVLTISVLKDGVMSILQGLADLRLINIKRQVSRCGVPVPEGEENDPFYSEANLRELVKNGKKMDEGEFVVKTMGELLAMEK